MACPYCNIEFHALCGEEPCCCGGKGFESDLASLFGSSDTRRKKARQDGSMLRDPLSTGRHRAAIRIPEEFFATNPVCGWAGLAAAGGGARPIIGCPGNVATDRHHGPDKSVLNNDDDLPEIGTNLHAICANCHARWHAQNDKFYLPPGWKKGDEARPANGAAWLPVGMDCKPHDPETLASPALIAMHEKWWTVLSPYQREQMGGIFDESAFGPESASSQEPESGGLGLISGEDAGSSTST